MSSQTSTEQDSNIGSTAESGSFVAVLSEQDPATPFWIGEVLRTASNEGGSLALISVRWYQASGSASDPYDAAYSPAIRTACSSGESKFLESEVLPSDVIVVFQELTKEHRLDKHRISEIKQVLYN